jgi:hypothetical protein
LASNSAVGAITPGPGARGGDDVVNSQKRSLSIQVSLEDEEDVPELTGDEEGEEEKGFGS